MYETSTTTIISTPTPFMLAFLVTDERHLIRHKCSAHILQVRMSEVGMLVVPRTNS